MARKRRRSHKPRRAARRGSVRRKFGACAKSCFRARPGSQKEYGRCMHKCLT